METEHDRKAATTQRRARRFHSQGALPQLLARRVKTPLRPPNSGGERLPSRVPLLIQSALHVLRKPLAPLSPASHPFFLPCLGYRAAARRGGRRGTCEGSQKPRRRSSLTWARRRWRRRVGRHRLSMPSSAAPPPLSFSLPLAACAPSPAEKLRLDPRPDGGSRSSAGGAAVARTAAPLPLKAPQPIRGEGVGGGEVSLSGWGGAAVPTHPKPRPQTDGTLPVAQGCCSGCRFRRRATSQKHLSWRSSATPVTPLWKRTGKGDRSGSPCSAPRVVGDQTRWEGGREESSVSRAKKKVPSMYRAHSQRGCLNSHHGLKLRTFSDGCTHLIC